MKPWEAGTADCKNGRNISSLEVHFRQTVTMVEKSLYMLSYKVAYRLMHIFEATLRFVQLVLPFELSYNFRIFLSFSVSSEQILVWSQHSHKWTKLRGIYGPTTNWIQQPRKKFVTSESSRDKIYNSLGYDHKTRYLYWHDSTTRAIYRQHVNDSLVMRRDDNIELVFEGTSGSVGGLAVDWIGENVIWADNVQMAILMARKHPDSTDVSRIVINAVTEAVGVAVDPIAG